MDESGLFEQLLREVNVMRNDPAGYFGPQSESEPAVGPLEPLTESPEMTAAVEAACEEIKTLHGDFTLDCVQRIYPELQKRGVWLGSIGHSIFPMRGRPKEIVKSLLKDENVPLKGRKANLLNPNYSLCGFGIVNSQHSASPPTCVMLFAGDFLPDVPSDAQKFDRQRTRAPADQVVKGGWKGSVMAVSADKRLFRDLTERWETDLPEGAICVTMKKTVIRTRTGRACKTKKEYEMRDGRKVTEEETVTL